MITALDIFYELERTQGNLAKEAILIANKDNEQFRCALHFILDTQFKSGISSKKLQKEIIATPTEELDSLADVFTYLKENPTGSDIVLANMRAFIQRMDKKYHRVLEGIIAQNFKTGVAVKSANKVYGADFIKTVEGMLAQKYEDNIENFNGNSFHAQLKLDGFKVYAVKPNSNPCTLWSRNGKQKEGFTDIENAVNLLPAGYVLDGELQPLGFDSMDAKDAYKLTSNSSGKGEKSGMCLVVYDILTIEEWNTKTCTRSYDERYAQYHELLKQVGSEFLVPLTSLEITSDTSKIKTHLDQATAAGKEGIMLKLADAPYEWKRSSNIVKCKKFHDIDVRPISFNYGTGKNKAICGSLNFEYKGNIVSVGSGLDEDLRKDIALNFDTKYKNRLMEVVYFEETTSKSTNAEGAPLVSLRFPTFKGWKDLER